MILINHTSAPIRKENFSPTSKARREASRNEFVEKSGMPDRVKGFREINSRQDRPRAQPGLVKPIPKWTEKDKEFDLEWTVQGGNQPGRRKNGIRFQKEEWTG